MPEGISNQLIRHQAQNWGDRSYKLERVREVAKRDKRLRFTTLLHHTPRLLLDSYQALRKDAASGVDEVTWGDYQEGLARRLLDLHDQIHRDRRSPTLVKGHQAKKPTYKQPWTHRPLGTGA